MSGVVSIKNLKKSYKSGIENLEVLQNVCLDVNGGETVVITGESGSGKSTLLNLIGGLDNATDGVIVVDGRDICRLNEHELTDYRNRYIGFIFQFHYLLNDFNALENVLIPALIRGDRYDSAESRALTLLSDVGLKEHRHHYPSELSGGERQRIAVARALMNEPPLILADEPLGNLDERNSGVVEDMLFSLVEKYRKTMVLVTHDPELAGRSDKHYKLEHGLLERA